MTNTETKYTSQEMQRRHATITNQFSAILTQRDDDELMIEFEEITEEWNEFMRNLVITLTEGTVIKGEEEEMMGDKFSVTKGSFIAKIKTRDNHDEILLRFQEVLGVWSELTIALCNAYGSCEVVK